MYICIKLVIRGQDTDGRVIWSNQTGTSPRHENGKEKRTVKEVEQGILRAVKPDCFIINVINCQNDSHLQQICSEH